MKDFVKPRRNADAALLSVAAILIALAIPVCARARAANFASFISRDSSSSQSKPDKSDKQDKADKSDKQNKSDKDVPAMTRIKIQVNDSNGKPVSNASVYIGFYESGGLLHHDKMAELDLKTNQDGSVRVPEIPQGKIRIQVLAKGWHTFGRWYDIEKPEELVQIRLLPPPHWF